MAETLPGHCNLHKEIDVLKTVVNQLGTELAAAKRRQASSALQLQAATDELDHLGEQVAVLMDLTMDTRNGLASTVHEQDQVNARTAEVIDQLKATQNELAQVSGVWV